MSTTNNQSGSKRPYATLDLKATEIKVSKIGEPADPTAPTQNVPLPLPPSAYATAEATSAQPAAASPSATQAAAAARAAPAGDKAAASSASASTSGAKTSTPPPADTVIVHKRGGFLSHLAASLVGGAVALGGWAYGLPELQKQGLIPAAGTSEPSGIADRFAKIEAAASAKLEAAESRLAALEKSSGAVGELKEAQLRLVAETKAALASAASDAGAPDQLERLTAVENRLKALSDAGASDPGAGRLEQLAALTGKVSDLETSLATQLTALRKSVAGDVEARVVSAAEAAEAAKSGMQRIDRDMASLKTESVKLDEHVAALKAEIDRVAEQNKVRQEELANLKVALADVKSGAAKPGDVTSAIAPVSAKIAEIEKGLKDVADAEAARQSNAERVVLALELQNLKRALDRGQKYEEELAEVEKASGGKFDLAPLTKFKDQGVPTLADLTRDFRPSVNAMIDAETATESTSVVDKLLAGAKSVVRVRRTDLADTDMSAEAIAARMEKALKDGRLGDVLTEAGTLSPKAKDAAQPFLDRVSARASVDKALASLEGQLKSSLTGTSGEPQTKTQ
jgi:hypothetical protein